MTRNLCFFFYFFAATGIHAQENLQLAVEKLKEYKFKNWDSVEYYGTQILDLASSTRHRERGLAYQYLGVVQYEKYGRYDSALLFYDKSLLEYNYDLDSALLSTLYNNYGVVHKIKANYETALESFFKALDFVSLDTTSKHKVTYLNNIGEVSLFMGKKGEAEKYHQIAYKTALHHNDSMLIGNTLVYLGNLASTNMESQKAIEYFEKALKFLSSFKVNTANIIMNIGVVYHVKGELHEAISYYQEAIIVATKFNSSNSIALCNLNIGEAMLALDDPNTVSTLEKAIEVATEFELNRVLLNAHQFLASYYQNHLLYKLALEHYKLYKKFNDVVLNEGSIAKLNSLNVKFSTAQKESQIANQELEIEQKSAAIIEERNQKITIATGLVFILLIGGLFYLRSQMRQRARVQQAVIQEKELGLKAVFVATEIERQRISKDLHDGVGQQISGVKMQLESLTLMDNTQQAQKELIVDHLHEAAQEIRQISHQLMPRSLEEEGLIPSLEDLFNKTFTGTSIKCSFEHHKAEKRYPQEVELSLFRITQELINNILKHANAKNVDVQLYKIKDKLVMTVEDDGVGFDVSEKSEGHGLLNIKSRIETVNGNVEFESSDTSETVITLSIPLNTANNG